MDIVWNSTVVTVSVFSEVLMLCVCCKARGSRIMAFLYFPVLPCGWILAYFSLLDLNCIFNTKLYQFCHKTWGRSWRRRCKILFSYLCLTTSVQWPWVPQMLSVDTCQDHSAQCLLHSMGHEWNCLPRSVSPYAFWDYSFNSTHQPPSAVICLFPSILPRSQSKPLCPCPLPIYTILNQSSLNAAVHH